MMARQNVANAALSVTDALTYYVKPASSGTSGPGNFLGFPYNRPLKPKGS
jgi:hypothetical protein